MHGQSSTDARQDGPFAVDADLALGALRYSWGDAYRIAYSDRQWLAVRRDGLGGAIAADVPDELNRQMREDYGLKPVMPQ
jgi:hypothetical protein